jgi:hypothetical protein
MQLPEKNPNWNYTQIVIREAIADIEGRKYTYEQSDCSTTVWRTLNTAMKIAGLTRTSNQMQEMRRYIDCRVDLDCNYPLLNIPYLGMKYWEGAGYGLRTANIDHKETIEIPEITVDNEWIISKIPRQIKLDEIQFGDIGQMWSISDDPNAIDKTGLYGSRLRRGHSFIAVQNDTRNGEDVLWLWSSHPKGQTEVDGPGLDWYNHNRTTIDDNCEYHRIWLIYRPYFVMPC